MITNFFFHNYLYNKEVPQRRFKCIFKTAFHNCSNFTKYFHNWNDVQQGNLLAFVKKNSCFTHLLISFC